MDSATKTKIISFSIFGILILGVIWLFINAGNSQDKKDEDISLRAIDSASVSISDIMAQGSQRGYEASEPSYPRVEVTSPTPTLETIRESTSEIRTSDQDEKELEELQKQLRANMRQRISQPPMAHPQPHEEPRSTVDKPYETPPPTTSPRSEATRPTNLEASSPSEQDPEESSGRRNRFHNGSRMANKSILASVLGDQEVSQGSSLKMVLLQDIYVEGITIPKGSAIYGSVQIQENRLYVSIQSIRHGDQIFSYNKQVYDRDGMLGIHLDSNDQRNENIEVAEEVAARTGVTTGVVGQVVQGVQSIFKRRGSNTVVIKSNYKLILK